MTKTDFINLLAPLAQEQARKRSKWILPSVCIAQAALETGWGSSSLMTKANAFFGIKAGKSWTGKVYSTKTKECYDGVNYTTITDLFRAYDSLEESVADYYDLITGLNRYAAAVNEINAEAAIMAIKNGGYATSPTYVTNVMAIINANKLTNCDGVVTGAQDTHGKETAQTATTTHTVVKGDTLSVIAKKYRTTVEEILAANKATYPKITANYIVAGWKLVV